jgi:hypothetical protein
MLLQAHGWDEAAPLHEPSASGLAAMVALRAPYDAASCAALLARIAWRDETEPPPTRNVVAGALKAVLWDVAKARGLVTKESGLTAQSKKEELQAALLLSYRRAPPRRAAAAATAAGGAGRAAAAAPARRAPAVAPREEAL